jgi:hypothetical protein
MAAKRPTGELPKRNSNLAKFIAGNAKTNKLNPAQSRVAAGKYRDTVKKTGAKTMDQTGAALTKSIRDTRKSGSTQLKQTNLDKTAGTRNKSGASALKEVTKRFGITAREARDIATAVSTAAKVTARTGAGKTTWARPSQVAEVAKQVKEVGVAAVTGKKGTSAGKTTKQYGETYYNKGKKRK